MPPVFEFAPAGDRLTLGGLGDRVKAADRQPLLLATARPGDEQQQGEESDRKRPPTPITRHDSLPDRAETADSFQPCKCARWYGTRAPERIKRVFDESLHPMSE